MSRMKRLLSVGLIGCFCSISAFVYGKAKEAPFMLTEMKCENLGILWGLIILLLIQLEAER